MQYEMMMIYNVQRDKILTDTDITSPHLKRVELEAKIWIYATPYYYKHKRFSYVIQYYNMQFRDAE